MKNTSDCIPLLECAGGESLSANGKAAKRLKLLEYHSNPNNSWLSRQTLATEVLGYSKSQSLWNLFSAQELDEIASTALKIRRKRCATLSAQVDLALLNKALAGDVAAIKLYYQRYESWHERHNLERPALEEPKLIVITKRVQEKK